MIIRDVAFNSLHRHHRNRCHAGQSTSVVHKYLDNQAIESGSSKPTPPPNIFEHIYEGDNDIAEVHRWNESAVKALFFDFVEIVSVRLIEDKLLLSSEMEKPPT
jgi:hypothetical protein